MFDDRSTAGRQLADRLMSMPMENPVVLALPRGGVPVALPIAEALNAPLDLILVRKIGMPSNQELAAGALAEGGDALFNGALLKAAGLTPADFAPQVAQARQENADRRRRYLAGRPHQLLQGRTVVVVDDGIATGATVFAALHWLKSRRPGKVILAVPVAAPDAVDELRPLVDTVVCLLSPSRFWAVGAHYRNFDQTSDAEVAAALAAAPGAGSGKDRPWH
ncbi:phosphoribosyltransferase [Cribrihabitans neustonicus]|uniref:phosphoribosyltransferase n=1 Tax=Cribrihabitans neustonicus TaxID=1429085 RepID=UPI003B593F8F